MHFYFKHLARDRTFLRWSQLRNASLILDFLNPNNSTPTSSSCYYFGCPVITLSNSIFRKVHLILNKKRKQTKKIFQGQPICTEGQSLFKEDETSSSGESYAFTQYPRPTPYPSNDSDQPHEAHYMGYSVISERYRLTNWFKFNSTVCDLIFHEKYV